MLQEARTVSRNDYLKPICSNYRYSTPTENNCKSDDSGPKKKPFVSRVHFQLTIIVAHFSGCEVYTTTPPRCPIPFLLCIISSRKGTPFGTHAIDKWYPFHIPSLELCITLHWWIQGRGPGGPGPPLFFDQNEARRVWMTSPSPLI